MIITTGADNIPCEMERKKNPPNDSSGRSSQSTPFSFQFQYLPYRRLECKPANLQQENFTGQRKNKQNLILLFRKETIFHIFPFTFIF